MVTCTESFLSVGGGDVFPMQSSLTHGGSVSDMLSAVSERVMQRWRCHDIDDENEQPGHDFQLFYDKVRVELSLNPRQCNKASLY